MRQQFLRIKFEYVLNKLYEDAEEVFVGPANLGGWAARLLKAEASDDTPQENAPPSKYILRDRCGSHLIGKTIKVYWPTHDDYLIGFVRRMVSPQEDAEGTHLVYYPYIKDCVGEILMISPKGPICEFCIIDDTIPIKTFREKK